MEKNTKVSGKMGNKMGKENFYQMPQAHGKKADGLKEKGLDGLMRDYLQTKTIFLNLILLIIL